MWNRRGSNRKRKSFSHHNVKAIRSNQSCSCRCQKSCRSWPIFLCVRWLCTLLHRPEKVVLFTPGKNEECTVQLYKKELGKFENWFFLCNVTNVDNAVDRKAVENKKVSTERGCIETSPIFQPSNIVAGQQKQNPNGMMKMNL